ncbi:invasion associated locus B family protein [Phyllobacterium sp. YR531]|uniref:invasion associated locus B family protein n=1 Tax=Phyllobacterium sp. YR531 TaxID=1144343 RepID=UPI00026FA104|nr:invasion associated locus B family protein [Phyllobacterium sp. YR531]EJN05959.1 Invasion associated locus B (IalB) protein [Phyllobacterium sp. YR531]
MSRHTSFWLLYSVALSILSCPLAEGQEVNTGFRVKRSEVVPPSDVKLGDYQRTVRPFENWTLVCDEKVKARQRVCNVTQTIENQLGQIAFSWSLAATKEGSPYMIVRTAPIADSDSPIAVAFQGRKEPVKIRLDGCNQAVCIGMLPVGPIMREQISKSSSPTISYTTKTGKTISIVAPLSGLSAAVEAIN